MLKIYGLKNCDTCRKAVKWMDQAEIAYQFIDVRKDGVSSDEVAEWVAGLGADRVLNRRGTTWRKLDDAQKAQAEGDGLVSLLIEHPSMIKRPVFVVGDTLDIGFSDDTKENVRRAAQA